MADKAIKVAVLKGDFASLVPWGSSATKSPAPAKLFEAYNEAMWTAKSTSGGFSVSFFWPAPDLKNGNFWSSCCAGC